jgi:hypothetical protein
LELEKEAAARRAASTTKAKLDEYEKRWRAMVARIGASDEAQRLRMRQVAWPTGVPRSLHDVDDRGASKSLELQLKRLFAASSDDSFATSRDRLRQQLLRWHPGSSRRPTSRLTTQSLFLFLVDKFSQKFGDMLDERDRELILQRVKIISQCLNGISKSVLQFVSVIVFDYYTALMEELKDAKAKRDGDELDEQTKKRAKT